MNKPEYVDIIEKEFADAVGASPPEYNEKITMFLAHKDRDGSDLDDDLIIGWIAEAENVLSAIGGGATSILVRGAWVSDQGKTIHEPTTLVYTYCAPEKILENTKTLKNLALEYGKACRQSVVALLLENNDGDWFLSIKIH